MFNHSRYDALVVGARCAGAAAAMLMARCGLKVLVIDHGRYAADTTSTHALMRGGVLQLHRWGLLPRIVAAGTPAVRSTEFHYGEDVVQVEIRPQHGVDASMRRAGHCWTAHSWMPRGRPERRSGMAAH
jgi:menaquinone-9 beta-reductase